MTVRPLRKKNKNQSYFSHEFIITNHGDIVSFVAMIIVMGLLYKITPNGLLFILTVGVIFVLFSSTLSSVLSPTLCFRNTYSMLSKLCIVLLIIHYSTDIFLHAARALHLAEYTKLASFGFTIWNILFLPVRMTCIILPFLVLHYGLGKHSVSKIDFSTGNFNTPTIR
ncbi:uncharacterized protein DEA37_0007385 [Paragonimus westermani]|uniref:TLC domain-containing protein n=1 Tax=Paragonimus westermani TaxID=34504 RepID=A0A5J4NWR2_9TREM|nr:uncharacterized protein DEA37_0007385 [Paragonimus westermani]